MTVKITPFGVADQIGTQILEFNVPISTGARTNVAPISTLTVTTR